jgi:hypothetical protein
VISVCVVIKLVEGRIAWQLDHKNNALELYKASQFMLSLLMAFRVVSAHKHLQVACSCPLRACTGFTLPEPHAYPQYGPAPEFAAMTHKNNNHNWI